VMLLGAAHLYVNPVGTPLYHGLDYSQLSVEPFKFSANNPLQLRILTPLVAHYLGFGGSQFMHFIRVVGGCFLVVVYVAGRRNNLEPVNSLLGSALFALTLPIISFIRFPGYTEITSYLCIFLAMLSVNRWWMWPLFLSLSILNHESNLCILPWFFIFHAWCHKGKWLPIAVSCVTLAISAVPWLVWVTYARNYSSPQYTPEFYLSANLWTKFSAISARYYSGLFATFKIEWVLPVFAVWRALVRIDLLTVAVYVVMVVCATAQLFLAHDTSRLLTLTFPLIWLGFLELNRVFSSTESAKILFLLLLINLFIPNYMCGTNYDPVIVLHSAPGVWILRRFFLQDVL
jgi:hypothetical protein